jgi:hypothetical protein
MHKYYIAQDRSSRECANCREIFPMANFSRQGPVGSKRWKNRHTYCKPCRSSIEARKKIEHLISRYPWRYHECSCGHIQSKTYKRCRKCNGDIHSMNQK